jgi:hypothetical protein
VIIHFLDEGIIKTIDLALWHETTTLGGGLFIQHPVAVSFIQDLFLSGDIPPG